MLSWVKLSDLIITKNHTGGLCILKHEYVWPIFGQQVKTRSTSVPEFRHIWIGNMITRNFCTVCQTHTAHDRKNIELHAGLVQFCCGFYCFVPWFNITGGNVLGKWPTKWDCIFNWETVLVPNKHWFCWLEERSIIWISTLGVDLIWACSIHPAASR